MQSLVLHLKYIINDIAKNNGLKTSYSFRNILLKKGLPELASLKNFTQKGFPNQLAKKLPAAWSQMVNLFKNKVMENLKKDLLMHNISISFKSENNEFYQDNRRDEYIQNTN